MLVPTLLPQDDLWTPSILSPMPCHEIKVTNNIGIVGPSSTFHRQARITDSTAAKSFNSTLTLLQVARCRLLLDTLAAVKQP
jgi:hypothetical protein